MNEALQDQGVEEDLSPEHLLKALEEEEPLDNQQINGQAGENGRVPRVLVVDRRGRFFEDIVSAVETLEPQPEVERLHQPTKVVERASDDPPDVVVVAPEEVTAAGLRRLAKLHRAEPRTVIVLSENGKPVSVKEAAACGASDILTYPAGATRMRGKLKRAVETAEALHVTERIIVKEQPAPVIDHAKQQAQSSFACSVISASGGSGKTFFAINLAAYLAKARRGKVLLVDFDLQFGEVAVSLHLRPERTIAELSQEDDIAGTLGEYVEKRHRSGFDVLCAPADPVAAEGIGSQEAIKILEAAKSLYDHVIVDTPASLNDVVLAALDQSQFMVAVATLDVPSLRNLKVFFQTIEKLNMATEEIPIIVNKAEMDTGVELREADSMYPQGFAAVLPYSKEVTRSINHGVPVLNCVPEAEISRKIFEAAIKLWPPGNEAVLPWSLVEPAQPSGLRRLFKRNGR